VPHVALAVQEQRQRLLKRLEDPEKLWKFSAGDIEERLLWNRYQEAYEHAIRATSTDDAPWYVVPADHKWFTHALVAEIIVQTLERLDLSLPEPDAERRRDLASARRQLLRGK